MITREHLKSLVLEQEKWVKSKDRGMLRQDFNELKKKIKIDKVLIITGPRRSGKSTLLLQIMDNCFSDDDYYYFNFDDERLVGFNVGHFNLLLEVFIELFGERKVFFCDEIQNVVGWERFISRLYEQKNKIILTGSNAYLLSKELATHLTGRHLDFTLFPFSFKEYLKFKKIKYSGPLTTSERSIVIKNLKNFLIEGGFPERVKFGEKEILIELFKDIIYKDVAVRYKIRAVKSLQELSFFLLSNLGRHFTYNKLKSSFNLGSAHTAKNYVGFLTNTYLFFELEYFSFSFKKRIMNPKKIYCIDNGLANELSFKFSEDKGRIFENMVFIELQRRKKKTYYWRDDLDKEVDFLIKEKMKVTEAIQVCVDLSDITTKKREINNLIKALKKFRLKEGLVITGSFQGKEKIGKYQIKYIPLWLWLLE